MPRFPVREAAGPVRTLGFNACVTTLGTDLTAVFLYVSHTTIARAHHPGFCSIRFARGRSSFNYPFKNHSPIVYRQFAFEPTFVRSYCSVRRSPPRLPRYNGIYIRATGSPHFRSRIMKNLNFQWREPNISRLIDSTNSAKIDLSMTLNKSKGKL